MEKLLKPLSGYKAALIALFSFFIGFALIVGGAQQNEGGDVPTNNKHSDRHTEKGCPLSHKMGYKSYHCEHNQRVNIGIPFG